MKMPVRIGESRPLHRICLAVGRIQTANQTAQNKREAEKECAFPILHKGMDKCVLNGYRKFCT